MLNPLLTAIHCVECHNPIPLENYLTVACPNCGSAWLNAEYDYDAVAAVWSQGFSRREGSLWRYHELLPLQPIFPDISMGEGWTPFQRLMQYEYIYNHHGYIYVKDERAQPTNSFKDRQASLSAMAMRHQGITECVLPSTGNAAVAYAAYCARAGIKLWLFLTSLVPAEKMREAALYGCEVIRVSGTYDETKNVAAEFAKHKGIYLDRGAKSVPGKEAMKTHAFEIAEQLGIKEHPDTPGKWSAPDWYIQGVSGGIGPLGVWKGFSELFRMGLIDKIPKLGIVQAAGCAPMVKAFQAGKEAADPVVPQTLIHVLATGDPGMSYKLLREACLSNGGAMIAVEDGAAFTAMRKIASKGGISVEPATAVAFAGLEKMLADGTIAKHETVVVNCSGHTFPAESHILGDQYEQYIVDLSVNGETYIATGLGAALQNVDEQVTTIVVVDDNPHDRRLIRRLLKSYKQYRIYDARDGKHALEVIHDRQPDLVITDLTMPDMDGFDLLETLKLDPQTAHIPVVVTSAKSLTTQDRQKLEAYTQSIWTKDGIDTQTLVADVVKTLGHEPISVVNQTTIEKPYVFSHQHEAHEEATHTIVVIDDNPYDMRLARRMIQSGAKNYNLIEANNGRDGLKAIYNYHPELVILDLNLPDVDGISIVEKLQKDNDLKDIPIIIYSARDLTDDEYQRIQAQLRSIVRKVDVNRQQFLTIIEDELA
jgi:threonine synthase